MIEKVTGQALKAVTVVLKLRFVISSLVFKYISFMIPYVSVDLRDSIAPIIIRRVNANIVVSGFLRFCRRGDFVFETLLIDYLKFQR